MAKIDWHRDVDGYSDEGERAKRAFHREAKARLKKLASDLGMAPGTYDLRTNLAGPASRGETTLHGERIYVQVGGLMNQIMFRTCKGRKDYTGGHNNFANIGQLDHPSALAFLVKGIMV